MRPGCLPLRSLCQHLDAICFDGFTGRHKFSTGSWWLHGRQQAERCLFLKRRLSRRLDLHRDPRKNSIQSSSIGCSKGQCPATSSQQSYDILQRQRQGSYSAGAVLFSLLPHSLWARSTGATALYEAVLEASLGASVTVSMKLGLMFALGQVEAQFGMERRLVRCAPCCNDRPLLVRKGSFGSGLRFSRTLRVKPRWFVCKRASIPLLCANDRPDTRDALNREQTPPAHRLASWLCCQYPLTEAVRYTGAGVRVHDGPLLEAVVSRVAAIVAMVATCRRSVFGVMITASHNPADENGVKVIRSDGGLLLERQLDTPHHVQGEYFADLLQEALQPLSHDHSATNDGTRLQPEATSIDREIARLNWLFERLRARMLGHSVRNQGMKTLEVEVGLRNDSGGLVIIGYDNRSSSVRLAEIARRVVLEATKSVGVRELGLTTTPFAQYAVWATQNGHRSSFAGYVRERLVRGYLDLCRALLLDPEVVSPDAYDQRTVLQVDCAHGTGSVTLDEVASSLDLRFRIVNHHRESQAVNQECGAEYVHRYARPGCGGGMQAPGQRMAALDGDADRLVYYGTLGIDEDVTDESRRQHTSITVYDGDWIALVLVTLLYRCRSYFIEEQRSETDALGAQLPKHLTVGCALTAYCSGIYRERIQSVCQGRVLLVPTGTQHGRDMVERHFDLAVYAEPNGHVGCYIAPLVLHRLRKLLNEYSGALSSRAEYAARCLVAIARLGNPTGSDGVSLLLTIEALLRTEPATHFLRRIGTLSPPQRTAVVNLQLAEEELVSEDLRLASRQAAVSWRFCADETRILEPYWAQSDIIDESLRWAHSKYPDWIQRGSLSAFVRPSRTEPIWRIRVEAASEATPLTQADVQVAEQVAAFIRKRLVAAFQRVSGTTKPQTYSERGLQRRTVPIHDTMTLAAFEAAAAERHGNPQLLLPPDWSKQLQSSRVVGIVLAAGQGSRFRAAYPKVVHSFCGKPMVRRVLDTLTMLRIPTLVVTHDSTENAVVNALFPLSYGMVRQREPLGTGHALYTALHYYLRDFHGDVLVLYGDNPGVDATLLKPLLALRANIRVGPATQDCPSRHFGVILSGSYTSKDAGTYGRVLRDDQSGALKSIVEYREARKRPDEAAILAVPEFYSGIMVADRAACLELLGQCRAHRLNSFHNDSSSDMEERFEFYATDVIQMAISQGFHVDVHCIPESSGLLWRLEGANTVAELEALELEASSSASHETPGMSSSGGV